MCVQNTDQFVCAALGKLFKSNCSWRNATGNHLRICTSHVYDDASAMTVSSQTCLRAENTSPSSSSSKKFKRNTYTKNANFRKVAEILPFFPNILLVSDNYNVSKLLLQKITGT